MVLERIMLWAVAYVVLILVWVFYLWLNRAFPGRFRGTSVFHKTLKILLLPYSFSPFAIFALLVLTIIFLVGGYSDFVFLLGPLAATACFVGPIAVALAAYFVGLPALKKLRDDD
jgi:hypothetical protein